jgi:hypothetical protein
MFEHEPERFRESKDRVSRLAAGIRKVLDREKGAVNVVVSVDQKQLHAGKVAREQRFPSLLLMLLILLLILLANFAGRKDQEQDQDQEQEFQTTLAFDRFAIREAPWQINGWCGWTGRNTDP